MTLWVDVATLNTAVNDPITVGLMTALKNNPQATREGIVGEEFTASGTFTVPAHVTKVRVELVGGGGAGGSSSTPGGGSGGAGGYGSFEVAVIPLAAIAVVVGAGGIAGVGYPTNGAAGGDSSFNSTISVSGGIGGTAAGAGGDGGFFNGTDTGNGFLSLKGSSGAGVSGGFLGKGGIGCGGIGGGTFVPHTDATEIGEGGQGAFNISPYSGFRGAVRIYY